MFDTLEFVMVAALFANLVVTCGAKFLAWAKGAEATVVTDVKKVDAGVVADVSKVATTVVTDVKKL